MVMDWSGAETWDMRLGHRTDAKRFNLFRSRLISLFSAHRDHLNGHILVSYSLRWAVGG